MRNTVGMKGVVYGVNNPSLSTVYEVDSCRGGGGGVVSAENIRGTEIQWRELHHRRSVSLPVVKQRACEISKKESIFKTLDRHRLDSAIRTRRVQYYRPL